MVEKSSLQTDSPLYFERLAELIHLASKVISELDLEELFQKIIKSVVDLLDLDSAFIAFIQEGSEPEEMLIRAANTTATGLIDTTIPKGVYLSGLAWKEERTFAFTLEEYLNFVPPPHSIGSAGPQFSFIVVTPIFSDGKVVGVLNVGTFKPERKFQVFEIKLLETFCEYVAIAYRNARLYDRELLRNEELRATKLYLEQNQRLTEAVLEQMADALIVVDINGDIIKTNPTAGLYFKLPWQDLIGLNLADIRPNLHYPDGSIATADTCSIAHSLYSGEVMVDEDLEYWHADTVLYLLMNVAPIKDAQGRVTGAVATLRDVTARRKMEEYDSHQERLRALGQLASGVAHDLNNLLSGVLGAADIIQNEIETLTVNQQVVEAVQMIQQIGSDGAEMVRRIQTFSRTTQNNASENISLAMVVHEALRFTESRWKSEATLRGIGISIEADVPAELCTFANAVELRELFTNLILNAVDALDKKGGRIHIRGRQETAEMLLIEIADNGVGMPEGIKNKIFEPFFTTKGKSGTGLGLPIVLNIVERLNGSIKVESVAEHGTTFFIRLPFVQPPHNLPTPEHKTPSPVSNANLPANLKVLIIDDEVVLGRVLNRMLQNIGYRPEVFSDPLVALERLKENVDGYDVVITDLGMPNMNGWEVAATVRNLNPKIPVILVTGWYMEEGLESLHERGVTALLTKPYTSKHLQETLQKILIPNSIG